MKFLSQIDSHVSEREYEKMNKRKRTSHHPSGISKCLRRQFYEWKQETVTNYTDTVAVYRMALGTMIHTLFSNAIEGMHFDSIEVEKELLDFYDGLDYPFHGYIDIYVKENMATYAIEVKSSFGYFIKEIKDNNAPRPDDVIQTLIYQVMDESIQQSSLIYLARDTFYRTEFVFPRDEHMLSLIKQAMISRASALEHAVTHNILPDREYNVALSNGEVKERFQRNKVVYKSDWQCRLCPFVSKCYAEEIRKGVDFMGEVVQNNPILAEIHENIIKIMR
jgi:hypothetical protein